MEILSQVSRMSAACVGENGWRGRENWRAKNSAQPYKTAFFLTSSLKLFLLDELHTYSSGKMSEDVP
jgi:hypothetical protein